VAENLSVYWSIFSVKFDIDLLDYVFQVVGIENNSINMKVSSRSAMLLI